MSKFCLAKKIGMTQFMDEDGIVYPITVLKLEPSTVIAVNRKDVDGYEAVVVGFEKVKQEKLNKPRQGFFKKLGTDFYKKVKEFRVDDASGFEKDSVIDFSQFSDLETLTVRSRTIGRGFAGTIKRHNFSRGPMTHGSKNHRLPGSLGGGTDPGRVFKGTRMGGHLGNENVTIKNLKLIKIEESLLYLRGSIPGKKNNLVEIFS
jgi:large subunit ribosomal protein L3